MSERDELIERLRTAEGGSLGDRAANEIERLANALSELVEVAELRGDSNLPAPPDDPKMWTARMQEAWDEAYRLVQSPALEASFHASKALEGK